MGRVVEARDQPSVAAVLQVKVCLIPHVQEERLGLIDLELNYVASPARFAPPALDVKVNHIWVSRLSPRSPLRKAGGIRVQAYRVEDAGGLLLGADVVLVELITLLGALEETLLYLGQPLDVVYQGLFHYAVHGDTLIVWGRLLLLNLLLVFNALHSWEITSDGDLSGSHTELGRCFQIDRSRLSLLLRMNLKGFLIGRGYGTDEVFL